MMSVFVTRRLPSPGMDMLRERFEVEANPHDRVLSHEEIRKGVKGKDALLCLLTDPIDEDIIDAGQDLKIISNYAVGYNNIDVAHATSRGIMVTNTPGVLSETTADLAFALLLAAARRLPEGDKLMREGRFKGWAPEFMLGTDVHGKTLGIVGLGRIGTLVAKRAKGFNMEVLYWSKTRKSDAEKELGVRYAELNELLKRADYISLHVPLTDRTCNLMGKREIGLMKSTAYLINTARGEIVDEEALIEALKDGKIRGAGLDVFTGEPDNINRELYELGNAILTPHIGSASYDTRSKMAEMAARAVIDGLEGRRPEYIINPEVLRS